jgi:hypothetical protein
VAVEVQEVQSSISRIGRMGIKIDEPLYKTRRKKCGKIWNITNKLCQPCKPWHDKRSSTSSSHVSRANIVQNSGPLNTVWDILSPLCQGIYCFISSHHPPPYDYMMQARM